MSTARRHDRISVQDSLPGEELSDQRHEYVAGIVCHRGDQGDGDQCFQRSIVIGLDAVIKIDEIPLEIAVGEFYEDAQREELDSLDQQ